MRENMDQNNSEYGHISGWTPVMEGEFLNYFRKYHLKLLETSEAQGIPKKSKWEYWSEMS